ncbi:uncharacterized protein QC763_510700 [Podospora pseudopauciseta]|uniref:Rhodopsin domain-containing protein n=2 Tax=Podospora TaxID=5144 RepID=A0ABR0HAU4_9PEZI|nr:hypothetical protein QC763_510700 [Podospora pseudopauciseta]KAK4676331.1 hypothetical protein QC764_510700 [Podospora pseudoanserina]
MSSSDDDAEVTITGQKIDPIRAAESNSNVFIAVVCVIWSLAFCTALVRFYTRAIVVRSFGKDDIFMVLAVLCGIGGLAAWIVGCHNGYGQHTDTIPRDRWKILLEAQFFQSVIEASFAFGFLKISIALSLLRLSRGKWYKWILWGLITFTVFYTLFAFITFMTRCQPVSGQWNPDIKPKCYGKVMYRNFGLFNTACNIFTDLSFATLPVPLIWSLQLQRRLRIYLIAILSGGYFGSAVGLGIAKGIYIIAYVNNTDGTFYPYAPFFGSLQLDIGIIAACAPTLRPLLGRFLRLSPIAYREANYYRAGKALDRLPLHSRHPGRDTSINGIRAAYLRQNTELDLEERQFIELLTGEKRGKWGNYATALHMEYVRSPPVRSTKITSGGETETIVQGGVGVADKGQGSDDERDLILPAGLRGEEGGLRGIVKTTEFRVEK